MFKIFKDTYLLLSLLIFGISCNSRDETKLLVFTKTAGFYHESIPQGVTALRKLADEEEFSLDTTSDASKFNEENLKQYHAVIFLNTTGDVLDNSQEAAFERFIQAGGGFVGIHAAADTEYDWPWYGKLVGGYFNGHPNDPNVREAAIDIVDHKHASTKHLPERWLREDEWYNYKNLNPELKVLATLDESSYEGGTNGDQHPIAWYHECDGGRSFYTGGGHTDESFEDADYLKHLLEGIKWAAGENPLDYNKATSQLIPDESRFLKAVLISNLDEPTELAVMDNGKVVVIERKGAVKIYNPSTRENKILGNINVNTTNEDGLMGVALDPDFESNNWIYLYYSPAGSKPINLLSRFVLKDEVLEISSEVPMLEVDVQRDECCHTGGSLAFDSEGNLFISTGDNTNPFASDGYAPIDGRDGRKPWDARRSSSNTNDLRGSILRIHPEEDGSYSVPEGNLFPEGGELEGRKEIYVMGNRNPYRIAVDPKTGFLYWGEVGPDAGKDSIQGPKGYDEVNQARKAGYFGWPLFVADNQAYHQRDFDSNTLGEEFNPEKPINNSPFNTGSTVLPPAQKAFIYYPYDESEEFPLVGKGGRTAMAGPVFYSDLHDKTNVSFPDYYDGKLFIYEWIRDWIMVVTMNEEGDYVEMEPFMPNETFSHPMDMQFGKDGAMYMLEYGPNWFSKNEEAQLVRIEYTEGNRTPNALAKVENATGAAPFTAQFSSEESFDYEGDELSYSWSFSGGAEQSTEAKPQFTFEEPGIYQVVLKVEDSEGASATSEVEVMVGNDYPAIDIALEGNQSFYWYNQKRAYQVKVSDKEDGALNEGIQADEVSFFVDYLPQGYDMTLIAQGHQTASSGAGLVGKTLIEKSDCKACHGIDEEILGPSYLQIAERYKDDASAEEFLAGKIIEGGSGNWGDREMAAHPQHTGQEAVDMVKYILALGEEDSEMSNMPLTGTLATDQHQSQTERGVYILTASYTDKGGQVVGPLNTKEVIVLRYPRLEAEDYVMQEGGIATGRVNAGANSFSFINNVKDGSHIAFEKIDLTGIQSLEFRVSSQEIGGQIQVRQGSGTGALLGVAKVNPTGSNEKWTTVSADLQGANGVEDLYFTFSAGTGEVAADKALFQVDWIGFNK